MPRCLRSLLTTAVLTTFALPVVAQQFGGSLAVSGDHVLVGETQNMTLPGIVYVFGAGTGTWHEVDQLMVSDEGSRPDGFGRALAADAHTLLVGAPGFRDGAGMVYAFRRNASGSWTQSATIAPAEAADSGAFGSGVVLLGDVALISAPAEQQNTGAVYVFKRSAEGRWSQHARLVAHDAAADSRFGSELALDDDAVLVATGSRRGEAATVFAFGLDHATDQWVPTGTLAADGLGERSGFGSSLGLRDGLALIGAPNVDQRVGAVLVFRFDGGATEWALDTRLSPFTARSNVRFGTSIVFDGSETWIGAPGEAGGTGAFYLYRREAGKWVGASKLTSTQVDDRASFASSAAIGNGVAVVGAAGVDSRAGAAVIFARSAGGDWREQNVVINEVRGLPAIAGEEVDCDAGRAAGFECSNISVLSFLPIKDMGGSRGTRVNDIWGWTDPESGREYAIVGRTDGTAFVDISDPSRPVFVADLPKTAGSRSSIWRDMKVYRNHVYIVADAANEHGVQVFDLRELRNVQSPPATLVPTYTYDGIHSAHNIVINEQTGYAFAVGNSSGGETCGGGLHMINLQEPGRPTFAGCFADSTTGRRKTGYSHDAQCVVYQGPDEDHRGKEICLGSNETALSIADVSNKDQPIALATVSYPNVAYTHQGWLTEDHRYFYQNDEGDEPQGLVAGTRTLVWDVTDLDDPVLVKEYIATTTTTDHNLYVRGNLMYQSNYGSGLRILDISDPENPMEIGFLDTTPYGGSGSWSNYPFFESGVIAVTSTGDGLFVVKAAPSRLIP